MKKNIKVIGEERIFDGYFKIDKGTVLEEDSITYDRFKLTRPDAVAILIYNEDSKKITLVKQFRYPIQNHTADNVLEAVAGKIDGAETPKSAAVRETREEIGYIISEERLDNPIEMFPSPGYSSEKIYVFLVVVKDSDKDPDSGGGLADEHENIEIVEMDVNEFIKQVKSNQIKDAKTIIAANLIKL